MGSGAGRAERRAERERERAERERAQASGTATAAGVHRPVEAAPPPGWQVGRPLLVPGAGSGAVILDRELDRPVRTRAETVTGAGMGTGGTVVGTSRYFPSTVGTGADAGPSRRRRGDEMPLD